MNKVPDEIADEDRDAVEVLDMDSDDFGRAEWNDLESNYEKHDVAEALFLQKMASTDYEVEQWGIDYRHLNVGVEEKNRVDFKIRDAEGNHVANVELKSKAKPDSRDYWFGRYNKDHYEKIQDVIEDHPDVPTFVAMYKIDKPTKSLLEEAYIPIYGDERTIVGECFFDQPVIITDESYYRDWEFFLEQLGTPLESA